MNNPIKILVVDDSAVIRDFLSLIFNSEDDLLVVGTAKNGQEAVQMIAARKPDIVTMDIQMPVMNGFEATRIIMENNPVPIIVVTSSFSSEDVENTFKAMDSGAVAVIEKPVGNNHPDFNKSKTELLKIVRMMAEIKVVKRKNRYRINPPPLNLLNLSEGIKNIDEKNPNYKLVAIGVSTGGPQILNTILSQIPANFSLPVVIVQHISDGFLEGMVEWLNKTSALKIEIAKNGEAIQKGRAYFCPTGHNIGINQNMVVELTTDVSNYSIVPSVSYMFRSVSENFENQAIGILLTGMGRDGAEELALMKECGALTIVQNQESCIVFGMPAEAIKLNAHKYIMSPQEIVNKLIELNELSFKF